MHHTPSGPGVSDDLACEARTAFARFRPEALAEAAFPALAGADGGELFAELRYSQHYRLDDGAFKDTSASYAAGFGLRRVNGDRFAFAHDGALTPERVASAGTFVLSLPKEETCAAPAPAVASGRDVTDARPVQELYHGAYPLAEYDAQERAALLQETEALIRSMDPRVKQAGVSLAAEIRHVMIVRADMAPLFDTRPLLRVNVSVILEEGSKRGQGSAGYGGREAGSVYLSRERLRQAAERALAKARADLHAVPSPAGEMTVVLGPGWPGVLLHEAVGHGLEGDFCRKGSSVFSGALGRAVASPCVSVTDRGDIPGRRGSLRFDDEGTPTGRTPLIENGVLTGYMQDRMNAGLSGMALTGNGRRESYAHPPMPRMTNTYMENGAESPEAIIASVKHGFYAPDFGGGQVDITSGQFVFSATEAYVIENGKIGPSVKGATLIGSGHEVLKRVLAVGNDGRLDDGVGVCGKAGQGVPVGVGQPTVLIDKMTVGGSAS